MAASENCRLCGTPLGSRGDPEGEFCCAGCARVHTVLSGLDADAAATYFRAAQRLGVIPGGKPAVDPSPSLPADPDAVRSQRFTLAGQSCPSCAWVIEEVLRSQPGVETAEASFFTDSALIRYDMRQTSPDQLDRLLARLGYRLTPLEDESRKRADRGLVLRFVACAIITTNLMSLASLRYFAEVGAIGRVPGWLPYLELALLVPVLWLGYLPVLARAVEGVIRGTLTMDFLIALSVAAVLGLSLVSLFQGGDSIYFETCAGLITIALLGRLVEARLRERAQSRIAQLMRLPIVRVRRRDPDGKERFVATDEIRPGDLVGFQAGEVVPFDGVVEGAESTVSEAVLTGEPAPIRKPIGAVVTAGSTVVDAELALRVAASYDQTRLKSIVDTVEDALRRQESRLRSADRLAAWFTPAVVAIALAAWLVRLALYGTDFALSAAGWFPSVSVMAVACPCAFSLAGVSAMTATVGALLRRGIIVADLAQLEELARVRRFLFDKTGTLTEGEMSVEELVWLGPPRPELLPLVLAAEAGSQHPVARAICEHLLAAGHVPPEDAAPGDLPGGREVTDGVHTVVVGAATRFASAPLPQPARLDHTVVWFGDGDQPAGCLLLRDRIREEAAAVLDELTAAGHEVELVSGDRPEVTEWVAHELRLADYRGGVSLEAKRDRIAELAGDGVAYVGDGTNDALAMSAATVAIAVGRSSDEALGASGIVVTGGNLTALPRLLRAVTRLHRVVRMNYLWALLFNAVFIPIAVAGYLTPFTAMLLMLGSSIVVLTNSLRLRSG